MQALGDDDKATSRDDRRRCAAAPGRSCSARPRATPATARLTCEGDLTLRGATHPIAFDVVAATTASSARTATVKQTDWGMKPYSTLFGALKVVDEVEVVLDARRLLQPAQSR